MIDSVNLYKASICIPSTLHLSKETYVFEYV